MSNIHKREIVKHRDLHQLYSQKKTYISYDKVNMSTKKNITGSEFKSTEKPKVKANYVTALRSNKKIRSKNLMYSHDGLSWCSSMRTGPGKAFEIIN